MGKPVIGAFHVQPQNILGMMNLKNGRIKEYLLEKAFPGRALSFLRAPPQTRTSAINASGSSPYAFAKIQGITVLSCLCSIDGISSAEVVGIPVL